MPPEQALGQPVDSPSDIFSFGVVLYEMWTGSPPFSDDTLAAQFNSLLNQVPQRPQERVHDLHPGLSQTVLKALNKDREHRHRSSRDLLLDLERVKHQIDSGTLSRFARQDQRKVSVRLGGSAMNQVALRVLQGKKIVTGDDLGTPGYESFRVEGSVIYREALLQRTVP